MEVDLRIPGGLHAPSSARDAVDGLKSEVPGSVLDDVRLLVSELVTNSIRHAGLATGDTIRLHITTARQVVRVEVVDPGPGFRHEPAGPPTVDRGSGWGLYLVERIADRWGVTWDGATRVWFEIDSARRRRS